MYSHGLSRIVNDLIPLTNTINIQVNKENTYFDISGEAYKGSIKLFHNDSDIQEERTLLAAKDNIKASYSLAYLQLLCRASSL